MHIVRADAPNFHELRASLWRADRLQHPLYSSLGLEYQREYARTSCFEDVSFVILDNDTPVAGALLALRIYPDGRRELSGFGHPALYLEAPSLDFVQRQASERLLKAELDHLIEYCAADTLSYREFGGTLSPVACHLLALGAQATPHFTQIIDLTPHPDQLRQQVRKSYQSLINWGRKNLCLRLLDAETIRYETIERFRALHIHAAGRETRSAQSWELQYEMVRSGEAFVILGEWDGDLVTAALFLFSAKYGYYGVSASKRELFEKPLSHCMLWHAILHARELGCSWFEMGEQLYPAQGDPPPTSKELGISTFKRGFGGQTHLRMDLRWTRAHQKEQS